jgi:hypothetical protein
MSYILKCAVVLEIDICTAIKHQGRCRMYFAFFLFTALLNNTGIVSIDRNIHFSSFESTNFK